MRPGARRRRTALAAVAALCAGTSACGVDLPAAAPTCDATDVLTLMAQALPDAEELPCLTRIPEGWSVVTFEAETGSVAFALSHPVAGDEALRVQLGAECLEQPEDGADPEPVSLDAGASEDLLHEARDGLTGQRLEGLDGACMTRTYALAAEEWQEVQRDLDGALALISRAELAERLREESDGRLDLDGAA